MGNLSLDKQIFVVDPEPDFYSVIKREMKRMDYHLVFLTDIKGFFKKLSLRDPLLIILNIDIDGGRGLQFLRILRDSHRTRSLPVIVLSEKIRKTDALQLMRYKVDDFLTRNLDPFTYIKRIMKVIRRHEKPEKTLLETTNRSVITRIASKNGNGDRPKLLIVEDDPHQVRLFRFAVESRNYEVFEAENGMEGLKKVKELSPDLVVLDIMMPVMDGFELCKRIRSQPGIENTPIIMVSALAEVQSRVEGLHLGADDYLPKPYNNQELLARIEALLRRAGRNGKHK